MILVAPVVKKSSCEIRRIFRGYLMRKYFTAAAVGIIFNDPKFPL